MTQKVRVSMFANFLVFFCFILPGCSSGGSSDGGSEPITSPAPVTEQAGSGSSNGEGGSGMEMPTESEDEEEEVTEEEVTNDTPPVSGGNESPAENGGDGSDPEAGEGNADGDSTGAPADPSEPETPEPEQPQEPEPDAPVEGESEDGEATPTTGGVSQEWSDAGVSNFQVQSQSDRNQTDVLVTAGQVFAQGSVQSADSLQASADGARIPLQVDAKATWPDGSLRHAIVTVRLPQLAAGGSPLVVLDVGSSEAATGGPVTAGQLLATSFDTTLDISSGSGNYQASARQMLQNATGSGVCTDWGVQCKQWLSGPLVSEWIVGGPLSASNGDHDNLAAYFHIRAYSDGSGGVARVRVDTVVENNWAYKSAPRNVDYEATVNTGTESYNVSGLTHYDHARWHKVLWWQESPKAYVRLNSEQLQESRAVSRYADVTPTDEFLDKQTTVYEPMKNGDQTARMGNTGAQPSIGPLPRWTSAYVVSSDPRAFNWMLVNDDSVGSYSFHYRDEQTGRPLEITRHPYVSIAAFSFANNTSKSSWKKDLLPKCPGGSNPPRAEECKTPLDFNIAHHPSTGYVSYLATGDYYYLEEMQFVASYVELWMNAQYRDYEKGHLVGQVRGQAWSLRSILDAAFATPDEDPLKSYYEGLVENNIAEYNRELTDSGSPIHVLNNSSAVIYPMNGQDRVGIAPWQQDFFTWAVGHAADQGVEGADRLLKWLSTFQIGRMTNWKGSADGYCWLQAAVYKLQIRDVKGGEDYASLDRAYEQTFPELQGLECNSQEMVNLWAGGKYDRGEMSGYAFSPTGFPSNFQIGLAMAASSGVADGDLAWQIFADRDVQPDYSNYSNFAVVPRE
ncbi:hypothetical protein SADO_15714 [Salinisphaera dokdonensis CL-ES53]|uniref:PcRGLX/YetA-like N-terminal RIFT barrel domain-containing protein n=1 Tax=Salinisphaera dokdonensis CL-ES53 TaxID=1304272 RepID=A0ABV2B491_9GAMM